MSRFWHSEQWLPSNAPIGYVYVLEPLDEPPVFALGSRSFAIVNDYPQECHITVGYGDYGVVYELSPTDPRVPATQDNGSDTFELGWARWESLSTFTTKTVNVTDSGSLRSLAISSTRCLVRRASGRRHVRRAASGSSNWARRQRVW